eukprot:TRINITY_DN6058_c0_g2_i1.p1 TRINITY_DN6058_c0_g2~~TRINITY_DN6058_c0_g2_i1.p1  ORF type:complete len:242 (+),score=31.21 TRINITY_DN6058_c0_g2_i1:129-854(+)
MPFPGWNPLRLHGSGSLRQSWTTASRFRFKNRVTSENVPSVPEGGQQGTRNQLRFPLTAAVTAGGLALTGDTIAQFVDRWKRRQAMGPCCQKKFNMWNHDYIRALRMGSYGFLLYGPGSHVWYQFLDHMLPVKSTQTLLAKVTLNQLVLGPCVCLVVFAWNFAWMGKIHELPDKYRNDLLPTLQDGWKFWIPASALNFGVVPLHARVAFMSTCAIFWNFYLSTSIGKPPPVVVNKAKTAAA